MSPEYPNWDTTDQEPTHGIASYSGAHNLRLGSKEIVFVGGNFNWCLLDCVKSSVISFVAESEGDLRLVFPLDAIYDGDPGKGYPHPMVTLATLFDSQPDRTAAFEQVVAPFLEKLRNSVSDALAAPDASRLANATDLQTAGVVVEINGQIVLEHQLEGAKRVLRFQFVGGK